MSEVIVGKYRYNYVKSEFCFEDQLPEMTDDEYAEWYRMSMLEFVRFGYLPVLKND